MRSFSQDLRVWAPGGDDERVGRKQIERPSQITGSGDVAVVSENQCNCRDDKQ